jgi:hypothetical protein
MKVGDLVRIIKDDFGQESIFKYDLDQLAIVINRFNNRDVARVNMVSDGVELSFPTKVLKVIG